MAERRMISNKMIDSDAFLEMPLSTQALYFHLLLKADDEGFVGNAKRIMRTIGAQDDELRVLLTKRFILAWENGIIVIKHWKIHNYIQSDRFKPTLYREERNQLIIKENNAYTETETAKTINPNLDTKCIQSVSNLYPNCTRSIGKYSIDKNSVNTLVGAAAPDSAFEALWKLYPKERREGKQHAFKAYKAARKAGVTDETIRAGIEAYIRQIAARHTQAQYVKTAGTWFYGNCWNDDYSEKPIAAGKQVGAQQYEQRTYTKEELEAINDPAMQALLESARKYTEGQHDD
jgi:hypothetical protein